VAYLSACKLCFGPRIAPRYRLDSIGLTIFECADCSLRFVGDYLPQERIDSLYARPALADYFIALNERHERKFAPRLREMARLGIAPGSHVLDVGCGSGEFPAMAAAAGYDAAGIDVSEPSLEAAARLHPSVDFRVAEVEELAADEPETYDVVTLWDVIEHVLRPHAVIKGCAAVLRPGGLIAVGTPNGDSIYDRVGDAAYRTVRPLGRLLLMQRYSEWHLQIWTRRTLGRLLEEHGLDVAFARKHKELTARPSLYVRQAGFGRLAALAEVADGAVEAAWPIRNKLTIYARKRA
jgi:2-polyprenyl-3-methyl-5-hydroxy-6-metoxy-1,4-benzoquinol methylase